MQIYLQKETLPSERNSVRNSPKTLQEELKLQLDDKPTHKAAGDRQNKIPSAPSKVL